MEDVMACTQEREAITLMVSKNNIISQPHICYFGTTSLQRSYCMYNSRTSECTIKIVLMTNRDGHMLEKTAVVSSVIFHGVVIWRMHKRH